MLFLTIILLIIITLVSYTVFDRDIFAPPTVVSLGFLFSSLCAYYNEKTWMLDFSSNTTWVIVVGVFSFMVGAILALLLWNTFHTHKVGFSHVASNIKPIDIRLFKTVIVILFQICTVVLLFVELRRITGGGTWVEIVTTYRYQTAHVDPDQYTMRLSSICRLFLDFSFVLALIYAFVIGTNIATKHKQPFINWVPVALCSILAFMQGYRSDMLRLWIAILVVAYTQRKRLNGWKNSSGTRKMIKRMAASVIVIALIFIAMRGIVGRKETDWDPLYYLTFYAGSPIAALDIFLQNGMSPSNIWGKETFYNLNQSISVYFNKPELRYIFYKEFRKSPSGIYIGNVYTALRPPYYDFGFGGMLLVMMGFGIFFTIVYLCTRKKRGNNAIDFRLLVYSYLAYTFFMFFYNLYTNFMAFGFVRTLIEMIVFRWLLVGGNIIGNIRLRFGRISLDYN